MTNEEKDLLMKDLCGRLPYGTICEDVYGNSGSLFDLMPKLNSVTLKISELGSTWTTDIDNVKPYLRPMSSMTEEEEKEYNGTVSKLGDFIFEQEELFRPIQLYQNIPFEMYDFFYAHHLDFRGFISMGLALEATEGMYGKEDKK